MMSTALSALADAGQDGWRGAATASNAALGALFLLLIAVVAALAYSIAGSGNHMLTSDLNDFVGSFAHDGMSPQRTSDNSRRDSLGFSRMTGTG